MRVAVQSVAARTFALYRVQRPRHGAYDVDSSIADQVFDDNFSHGLIADAVKSTKGQYLYYDDKTPPSPFKAFYHSRCGGQTASAKDVWINPEGNRGGAVPCDYCQKNHYRWRAQDGRTGEGTLFVNRAQRYIPGGSVERTIISGPLAGWPADMTDGLPLGGVCVRQPVTIESLLGR